MANYLKVLHPIAEIHMTLVLNQQLQFPPVGWQGYIVGVVGSAESSCELIVNVDQDSVHGDSAKDGLFPRVLIRQISLVQGQSVWKPQCLEGQRFT